MKERKIKGKGRKRGVFLFKNSWWELKGIDFANEDACERRCDVERFQTVVCSKTVMILKEI